MSYGIIAGHAFVDANKRTGTVAALAMLASEGAIEDLSILTPIEGRFLGQLAVMTASGELQVEDLVKWFRRIFAAD